MQLSWAAKQGLALIALGVVVPLGLFIWSRVAYRAVNQPISLLPGEVRKDFTVSFNALYVIGIQVERKLPSPTLDCLLGADEFEPKGACADNPSVLDVSWKLTSDGIIINTSSYAKPAGTWTSRTIEADLAWFTGQRGRRYTLDLNVAKDGRKLAITNPKLLVAVDDSDYQDITLWPTIAAVAFVALMAYLGGRRYSNATSGSSRPTN